MPPKMSQGWTLKMRCLSALWSALPLWIGFALFPPLRGHELVVSLIDDEEDCELYEEVVWGICEVVGGDEGDEKEGNRGEWEDTGDTDVDVDSENEEEE
ncbi:hypothetical protein SERLA73DRAFT_130724 [Serpula lacrymans var. lacrymans S7.3]|uniref:Uncharacterized protein n=1 Tax=Serpula lacrymans var. lacrymans (strain S7.3) TaxID=936435 RepID=F8PJE7_SERL3|nr:hypothetical protein SERLA73DRAFT_130724 [Serpula lacrymans var. lacrymans S7.3]